MSFRFPFDLDRLLPISDKKLNRERLIVLALLYKNEIKEKDLFESLLKDFCTWPTMENDLDRLESEEIINYKTRRPGKSRIPQGPDRTSQRGRQKYNFYSLNRSFPVLERVFSFSDDMFFNITLKMSSFYKEMVNRIVEEIDEQGLLLPQGRVIVLLFPWATGDRTLEEIEEPYTLHLRFSQEEIRGLKVLMQISSKVTLKCALYLAESRHHQEATRIDSTFSEVIGRRIRQIKAAFWWILLREYRNDLPYIFYTPEKECHDEFKSIFGTKIDFTTSMNLKSSEGFLFHPQKKNVEFLDVRSRLFLFNYAFISDVVEQEGSFLKDLVDLICPLAVYVLEHPPPCWKQRDRMKTDI